MCFGPNSYYDTCPNCGANLDPGEKCDCEDKEKKNEEEENSRKTA